jgi:hypothetical protein
MKRIQEHGITPSPFLDIPAVISMVYIFFFLIYADFEFYQQDSLTCSFPQQYSTIFFSEVKKNLESKQTSLGLSKKIT